MAATGDAPNRGEKDGGPPPASSARGAAQESRCVNPDDWASLSPDDREAVKRCWVEWNIIAAGQQPGTDAKVPTREAIAKQYAEVLLPPPDDGGDTGASPQRQPADRPSAGAGVAQVRARPAGVTRKQCRIAAELLLASCSTAPNPSECVQLASTNLNKC